MDWIPFKSSLKRIESPSLSPTSLPQIYLGRTQAKSGGSAASSQQRKRTAGRSTLSSTSSISAGSSFKVKHKHPSTPTLPLFWVILTVEITHHFLHDSDGAINRLEQPFCGAGTIQEVQRLKGDVEASKTETNVRPPPPIFQPFLNPILSCGAARHVR